MKRKNTTDSNVFVRFLTADPSPMIANSYGTLVSVKLNKELKGKNQEVIVVVCFWWKFVLAHCHLGKPLYSIIIKLIKSKVQWFNTKDFHREKSS